MPELKAISAAGKEITLAQTSIASLRRSVRGDILTRGDDRYHEARSLWNALYEKMPALIVRCADRADIMTAIDFARAENLPVAVRSGGHNVAGSGACNGGITLDLSGMKVLTIDSNARTARAEPGLTWGEFDRQVQAFGLATTGGICSQTGIGGVTLGGGFGWLMRKHGLALDNILSMDVVTPDGRLRRVNAEENSDLFFGIRGSHSNLAIVTAFEYRLHRVGPTVLAGMVLHPLERGKEVLRFYRDYTSGAPEELSAWAALLTMPNGPSMVAILACFVGSPEAGEHAVEPLRAFGPPVADTIEPMPYVRAQSMIDDAFPKGRLNYWKSGLLSALSDEVIDIVVAGFERAASPYSSVLIEHIGGAVSRVGAGETAFPHRTAQYDLVIMPMWSDRAESDTHMTWADELWQAVQPFSSGGVYVNYLSSEGEERIRAAYGANYPRLLALKNKYDSLNLFCSNQNVRPDTASERAQAAE
jgi:FAD/FMN-containing dehydrogenase